MKNKDCTKGDMIYFPEILFYNIDAFKTFAVL